MLITASFSYQSGASNPQGNSDSLGLTQVVKIDLRLKLRFFRKLNKNNSQKNVAYPLKVNFITVFGNQQPCFTASRSFTMYGKPKKPFCSQMTIRSLSIICFKNSTCVRVDDIQICCFHPTSCDIFSRGTCHSVHNSVHTINNNE